MAPLPTIKHEIWLNAPETRAVMDALTVDGGEARFVGGCVRNALMGVAVEDIDIATPTPPQDVMRRMETAGLRVIATGIEHGTVTAISQSKPFEITTLRSDVSTDGRRATVAFSRDWKEDAQRRDFTMNALYADVSGQVFDYVGGIADLNARRVRFIGDPAARIAEDYLRVLRLFRFHALYGHGDIDADGLTASALAKGQLKTLSGERIQKEMLRLLAADAPVPVLRSMAASGVLGEVLPGELMFERFQALCRVDGDNFFAPDELLRLGSLISDEGHALDVARRWRLSNDDRDRLIAMMTTPVKIVSYMSIREVRRALYRYGAERFKDLVRFRWAEDAKASNGIQWRTLLALADGWVRPVLPMSGGDVMSAGVPHGPLVGRVLSEVEEWWIDSDFTDDRLSLAERLKAVVQATV
ncbi:MAG: CCA tRNA nucleotidyltransferase [Alphaproteobacteria bacterium]|nr:CCA tRNA nucleotidyltransferase [Alphaproteobacteria bacterium]